MRRLAVLYEAFLPRSKICIVIINFVIVVNISSIKLFKAGICPIFLVCYLTTSN